MKVNIHNNKMVVKSVTVFFFKKSTEEFVGRIATKI